MRKFIAAAAVAAGLATFTSPATAEELKQITIGTNPAGTIAHVLGSALAKVMQEDMGIRSAVEPHGGTSSYLPLLDDGELTLGVFIGVDLGLASKGEEPYTKPAANIKPIARLMRLDYGYVVRADSGLKTVDDLKGKKVVVGIKSNIVLQKVNEVMLATAGLSRSDVDASDAGGLKQGLTAVVEGRADASAIALGIPALRQIHASVPGGIRVLALGNKATDDFTTSMVSGAIVSETQPSKNNVGVDAPINVIGLELFLNAGPSVDDETAYKMAKTIYENWETLQTEVAALKRFPKEDLALGSNPVPYHPGAAKFYTETGLSQ